MNKNSIQAFYNYYNYYANHINDNDIITMGAYFSKYTDSIIYNIYLLKNNLLLVRELTSAGSVMPRYVSDTFFISLDEVIDFLCENNVMF